MEVWCIILEALTPTLIIYNFDHCGYTFMKHLCGKDFWQLNAEYLEVLSFQGLVVC